MKGTTKLRQLLSQPGMLVAPGAHDVMSARLFYLPLSLAEMSFAVEQFGQPSVVDGYDVKRFVVVEHN